MIMLSMNSRKWYCIALMGLLLVPTIAAQPTPGTLIDKIIAHVDDEIILQSELDETLEAVHQQNVHQGKESAAGLKYNILESLVLNKLLLAKAKQEGIVIPDREVEEKLHDQLQYLVAQLGSAAAVEQEWHSPMQAIKRELRTKIKEQLMIIKMRSQIIEGASATPEEVKSFFDSLPPHKLPYYPAEVEVRQIVRHPCIDPHKREALAEQLTALKVRLQNGEPFEELAQTYSQDPGSASQGGALGFWKLGELTSAYEKAALALQPGQVSDPVITPFGLHLIQLIAREKDRYNSRHILLKIQADALDIEAAKTYLAQLRAASSTQEITFRQALQQATEEKSNTMLNEGLLTRNGLAAKMSVDALPPDIFFAIEQLAPGDLSEPMVFTTSDGQQAMRVLYLKARTAPHQANLAQDYAKLKQMVIHQKQIETWQAWLEKVEATTTVELAPEYQDYPLFKRSEQAR